MRAGAAAETRRYAPMFDAFDRIERPHIRDLYRLIHGSITTARAALDDDWLELVRTGQWDTAVARALEAQGDRISKRNDYVDTVLEANIVDTMADDTVLASMTVAPRFDLVNARAVEWAAEHSSDLVTRVDGETRRAIRDSISRAVAGGGRRAAEAEIRAMVGLTRPQARALARWSEQLPPGWSEKRRLAAIERRTKQMIRHRAETIARTEVRRSTNAGMKILWDDQAAQGLFDRRLAVRIPYDSTFVSDQRGTTPENLQPLSVPSNVDHPPLHPRCRCTMGLDFEPLPAAVPTTAPTPATPAPNALDTLYNRADNVDRISLDELLDDLDDTLGRGIVREWDDVARVLDDLDYNDVYDEARALVGRTVDRTARLRVKDRVVVMGDDLVDASQIRVDVVSAQVGNRLPPVRVLELRPGQYAVDPDGAARLVVQRAAGSRVEIEVVGRSATQARPGMFPKVTADSPAPLQRVAAATEKRFGELLDELDGYGLRLDRSEVRSVADIYDAANGSPHMPSRYVLDDNLDYAIARYVDDVGGYIEREVDDIVRASLDDDIVRAFDDAVNNVARLDDEARATGKRASDRNLAKHRHRNGTNYWDEVAAPERVVVDSDGYVTIETATGPQPARTYVEAHQAATRQFLDDLVGMGPGDKGIPPGTITGKIKPELAQKITRHYEDAHDFFPTRWVDDLVDSRYAGGEGPKLGFASRGENQGKGAKIIVSQGRKGRTGIGTERGMTTMLHEVTHTMEYQRYRTRVSSAWRNRRARASGNTAPNSLRTLEPETGYASSEMAFGDQFADMYAGKVYTPSRDYAYEVVAGTEALTVGMESLWYDTGSSGLIWRDRDYWRHVVGQLAAL